MCRLYWVWFKVAIWLPFRKRLLPQLAMILFIGVIVVISNFDFDGRTLVLILEAPGHCLLLTGMNPSFLDIGI